MNTFLKIIWSSILFGIALALIRTLNDIGLTSLLSYLIGVIQAYYLMTLEEK